MSFIPISLTTIGSSAEEFVEAPEKRQYILKYLTAFKDSTFTLNLSIETDRGYRTIFTETRTDGGTIVVDDPIALNPGEKLVSQSSTAGIDINATFEIRSAL